MYTYITYTYTQAERQQRLAQIFVYRLPSVTEMAKITRITLCSVCPESFRTNGTLYLKFDYKQTPQFFPHCN